MYHDLQAFSKTVNANIIRTFKTQPCVRGIIETLDYATGCKYLDCILKNSRSVVLDWALIKRLNDIGAPVNYDYIFLGQTHSLSATTLRYVLFTLNILDHIDLAGVPSRSFKVIEIGGGYGFQSVLICAFARLYEMTVEHYTILDLLEIVNLQKHFIGICEQHIRAKLPIECSTLDEQGSRVTQEKQLSTVLVANYSLGEFDKDIQDEYIDKVVQHTPHGYLCWNFSPTVPEIHPYFRKGEVEITEEEPQTNCLPTKNYIIKY